MGRSLMYLESFPLEVQEQVKEARKLYPDVILKKIKRMRIYFI